MVLLKLHVLQQSSRSSYQEASKVVRVPEPFGSENHEEDLAHWQDFQVNFRAWLYEGNPLFEEDLHGTELHGATPIPTIAGEPDEVQQRCVYSILTGLLRGKPLRLLRQVTERNGFEVWRQLVQLCLPKTKSRAISLLSALMNIFGFATKDRTRPDSGCGTFTFRIFESFWIRFGRQHHVECARQSSSQRDTAAHSIADE